MTDWVTVNGARSERSFLRDSVSEARSYAWEKRRLESTGHHGHCMVCTVALSESDVGYHSEGGWLCPHCFRAFVEQEGMS